MLTATRRTIVHTSQPQNNHQQELQCVSFSSVVGNHSKHSKKLKAKASHKKELHHMQYSNINNNLFDNQIWIGGVA